MNEKIKEILDKFNKGHDELTVEEYILLENYITNLQQLYENGLKVNQNSHKYITELEMNNAILKEDLDKANDIIKKDRRFYKCRMDEYVDLKKENEKLKEQLQNKGIIKTCENCEWFGTCPHSYREYDYKQRNEKAIKYINNNKLYDFDYDKEELFEIVSDKIAKEYLLNILNGSDEK